MSSSSLASYTSDGTAVSTGPQPYRNLTPKETKHFDKCPSCKVPFDFLKRANSPISKVPLVLNCKHTVCEDCIRRLCLSNTNFCPICDEKFVVIRNQLDNLTEVFIPHYSLIGYLMWTKNTSTKKTMNWVPTGITMKTKQAGIGDAMDIETDAIDSSEVGSSMDSELNGISLSFEFSRCPGHSDGFLNIHCEDCDVTVCCYCYVENHGGHKPLYLYKLDDEEMSELEQSKAHLELILRQLQLSRKKTKELKTFDLTNVENEIKTYFADVHAKLHLAERNLRKQLHNLEVDDADLEAVNSRLGSAIWRVTQILNVFSNMMDKKQINVRALYEEIQDIKNIPCRLVSDHGVLEPIEFVCKSSFDNIEKNFSVRKLPGLEYALLPIEDWGRAEDECSDVSSTKRIRIQSKTKTEDHRVEDRQPAQATSSLSEARPRRSPGMEGGRTRIILTHLNDLNSFYVQKYSVQTSLKLMNKNIERKAKKKLALEDISLGRIYGVLYETKSSSHWRRGELVEIIKKGTKNMYSMFFMDYGNSKCVTSDKLRELDHQVLKRVPFAFECKLTNPNGETFDANAHLRLSQIIGEKELYVHYTSKQSGGIQEVDLLIPSSSGSFISVRDILQKKVSVSEEEEVPLAKPLKLFKNSKRFSVGQEEKVIVAYLKDPFHICIVQEHNVDALEKMKRDMKIFYDRRPAISCIPTQGTDVVVKYETEDHGCWHRASITSVDMSDQKVDVYFVDWGDSATVSWSDIKQLVEQFTKIECQAIVVKLADIQRLNLDEPWPQETIDFLRKQVLFENKFKMVVSSASPIEIALFQMRPSADICLNALLVERNYAISTGTISETMYWPSQEAEEVDSEDIDEFSYQMIKKAEELLIEDEDPDLKSGLKQQVNVVHFESPDLIFIKFAHHKAKEEEMNKEMQIHYTSRCKTRNEWKPSDYCVILDEARNRFYRGIIKAKFRNDTYTVYLYDHVRDATVKKSLIFVQDPYFKNKVCCVVKCRLSNIRPAGDRGNWSRLAIEMLQKIFKTYKIFHVKKTEMNAEDKMLGVVMWYGLSAPAKALEPSKLSYVPVNRMLVETGVAFSVRSAVSSSMDAHRNSALEKQNDEEMEKKSSSSEDEARGGVRKRSEDWNQLIEDEESAFGSAPKSWPDPVQVQSAEFDALLTCVGSDGCFYVRDNEMQALYLDMEESLNLKFDSLHLAPEDSQWRPSDICTILEEGRWYRGVVIKELDADEICAEMIDFGSIHELKRDQLYRHIMFPEMPPLVTKVKLYDVHPRDGAWCIDDDAELLKYVTDHVKVVIKGGLNCAVPSAEIYLGTGTSINELITQKWPHLVRYETKVVPPHADEEEVVDAVQNGDDQDGDDTSVCSKDSKWSDDQDVSGYTYAELPVVADRSKMTVVNVLKWGTEYKAVLKMGQDANSHDVEVLNAEIQEHVSEQPALGAIELDQPCVCFHSQLQMWCRATVYDTKSLEHGYVLAFFVDYGTMDMVTTQNLKEMRPEWFNLPIYNRIAIVNIELVQSNSAEHVLMQMNNLRGKSAVVEVVSEDPLKVHLYDGNNLCYQSLINCGILRAL